MWRECVYGNVSRIIHKLNVSMIGRANHICSMNMILHNIEYCVMPRSTLIIHVLYGSHHARYQIGCALRISQI